jgi:hypothetical protein
MNEGKWQFRPENIEWFIEGQAFSRSYDLAPRPPPPPLPSTSSTGETQENWERETTCWRERGEGVDVTRSRIRRPQDRSSINHSILPGSAWQLAEGQDAAATPVISYPAHSAGGRLSQLQLYGMLFFFSPLYPDAILKMSYRARRICYAEFPSYLQLFFFWLKRSFRP